MENKGRKWASTGITRLKIASSGRKSCLVITKLVLTPTILDLGSNHGFLGIMLLLLICIYALHRGEWDRNYME